MTTLRGAFTSPEHKRQYVRRLFSTIADRYDLITVLLSFGRDRAWKRKLVREARIAAGEHVVDLACGTGDLALATAPQARRVTGLDITLRMVEIARRKAGDGRVDGGAICFGVADMMALPLRTGVADVVTTGYGLRNVPELTPALDEIRRVLRPGGRLLSLDFNRPESATIRAAYLGYLTIVGAALGLLLHRDADTYRYIPESIRRYPGARGVAEMLRDCGFRDVRIIPLLGGLMTIHVATRR